MIGENVECGQRMDREIWFPGRGPTFGCRRFLEPSGHGLWISDMPTVAQCPKKREAPQYSYNVACENLLM